MMAYFFFKNGLVVNLCRRWNIQRSGLGVKLSKGMEVPGELAGRFQFAQQESAIAGTSGGLFYK